MCYRAKQQVFGHYLFTNYAFLMSNEQLDGCFQKQVQTFPSVRTLQDNQHVVTMFSHDFHGFCFSYNAWKEAAINTINCGIGAALSLCLSRSYRVQKQKNFALVDQCLFSHFSAL